VEISLELIDVTSNEKITTDMYSKTEYTTLLQLNTMKAFRHVDSVTWRE